MARETEIKFKIRLDDQNMPEKINWTATDGPQGDGDECKSIMIGMWDGIEKNTMRFDLWTKDMLLDDMKRFFHQTFLSMADSFERATDEEAMAADMRDFAHHFADKMKLISTSSSS